MRVYAFKSVRRTHSTGADCGDTGRPSRSVNTRTCKSGESGVDASTATTSDWAQYVGSNISRNRSSLVPTFDGPTTWQVNPESRRIFSLSPPRVRQALL